MEGKNTETKQACMSSGQEKTGNAVVEYNRRFEISNWLQMKECAICKVDIMNLCIECVTHWPGTGIEDCIVAVGKCHHAFHFHCLSRWFLNSKTCPVCESRGHEKWKFQKYRLNYGNRFMNNVDRH